MRLPSVLRWLPSLFPGVHLATASEREARTRAQLLAILDGYELTKWRFTRRIRIQEGARPHSHPVLTLNTRHPDDDALLLADYLHEQLHWFLTDHRGKAERAMAELRGRYPSVPVEQPEGAGSERSSYLHLIVCYLEYAALIEVLGADEARRVIEHWSGDHYMEIYKTVLRDAEALGELAARHGLVLGEGEG